jgi:hypothetical protein
VDGAVAGGMGHQLALRQQQQQLLPWYSNKDFKAMKQQPLKLMMNAQRRGALRASAAEQQHITYVLEVKLTVTDRLTSSMIDVCSHRIAHSLR